MPRHASLWLTAQENRKAEISKIFYHAADVGQVEDSGQAYYAVHKMACLKDFEKSWVNLA